MRERLRVRLGGSSSSSVPIITLATLTLIGLYMIATNNLIPQTTIEGSILGAYRQSMISLIDVKGINLQSRTLHGDMKISQNSSSETTLSKTELSQAKEISRTEKPDQVFNPNVPTTMRFTQTKYITMNTANMLNQNGTNTKVFSNTASIDQEVALSGLKYVERKTIPSSSSTNTSRDMGAVLDKRMQRIKQECDRLPESEAAPSLMWQREMMLNIPPGPLTFCLLPKAGTSTQVNLQQALKGVVPKRPQRLKVLVARHPLHRLLSAYRDKYLGGAILSHYGAGWQKDTGSLDSWDTRLYLYWLPALVSQGRVKVPDIVKKVLAKNLRAYKMFRERFVSETGTLLAFPSTREIGHYGPELMSVATSMVTSGKHWALREAVWHGFRHTNPEVYRNVSFSLVEFLHHVVWTHEVGVPDHHWMTAHHHCRPCTGGYHYILRLENLEPELSHLLHSVLGYPKEAKVRKSHSSRTNKTTSAPQDLELFREVPHNLMRKILKIYEHDFQLLGYKKYHR